jgi:hypothetical protein
MAQVSLGFNLSASAVGMSQGINAGVVELQKLGYAAKKTAADVSTLKTIELSRVFIGSIRAAGSAFSSFITGTAGAVAQVDDLSKRTGIAANVIQGYQLAAGQSGVSLRDVRACDPKAHRKPRRSPDRQQSCNQVVRRSRPVGQRLVAALARRSVQRRGICLDAAARPGATGCCRSRIVRQERRRARADLSGGSRLP